jgi:prolipoprotein diacylglyceryltransferase
MEAVQIGPFYVNWRLLTLVVSVIVSYLAVSFIIRRTLWKQSPLMDIVWSSLAIGFFSWKLSPYLLQPSMIWQSPLKGIMMQGGLYATWIGAGVALVYLFLRSYRTGLPLRLIADVIAYGGASFLAVRAIVGGPRYGAVTELPWGISLSDPAYAYHPIHLYELLLALVLILIYILGKIKPNSGRAGERFFLIGGAGLLAISLVMSAERADLLLTSHQWFALSMCLFGLILPSLYILWEDKLQRSWTPDDQS